MKASMTRLSAGMLILMTVSAAAQEPPSVGEIVEKANHMSYYQGDDGRARVQMTITDGRGREREREFTILRRDTGEQDAEQKFYVYFHRPADVRETVFMVWKYAGKDDERWLYLPALDVVKRIAASDERTSFVGSDFYYEDVSGRGTEEDHHELLRTTDTYYVVRSTPKEPDLVEFDSYTSYIDKSSFIPVRIEYERNGSVYRQADTLEVQEIQGYKTVTKGRMQDLDSGSETVLTYSEVEYDVGLPEDIFTERYLRRAPREYVR